MITWNSFGTKLVNLPKNATNITTTLIVNKKYLWIEPISAKRNIKKSVIVIKIVIAVINPASNPKILITISNNSSNVDGIVSSWV